MGVELGRVRVTGLEGVELRDDWNPVALVVLVVLLVAALAGVAVWRVSSSRVGSSVAGLVTIGLLTGRVLTTVADRVGRSLGEVDQGASGLTVRTEMTTAGSLETAALVWCCSWPSRSWSSWRRAGGSWSPWAQRFRRRTPNLARGRTARRGRPVTLQPCDRQESTLSGPIIELAEEHGG